LSGSISGDTGPNSATTIGTNSRSPQACYIPAGNYSNSIGSYTLSSDCFYQ
jgi:hypothetical protein